MVSSVVITAMSIGQLTSANLDFQAEMRKMEFLSKKLNPDLIKQFDKDGDGVGKYEFVIGVFVQLGYSLSQNVIFAVPDSLINCCMCRVLDEVDVLTWEQKFKELDTDGNGTLDEEVRLHLCRHRLSFM